MNPALFDQIPPFNFLTNRERVELLEQCEPTLYVDGQTLCAPDDATYDILFIVVQGKIVIDDPYMPNQLTRSAPTYFGELSVFFDRPRNATIYAGGAVCCLPIPGAMMRQLVTTNPALNHAFATALADKQRIFHAYEAFVNLVFSRVHHGVIHLRELLDAYRRLDSILHRASDQEDVDLNALAYVLPRLPEKITATSALYFSEDLPEMYQPVQEQARARSRRGRKRHFYHVLPGKDLILLRDRMTDTLDLITKLCIYLVETEKICQRLKDATLLRRLAAHVARGCPPEETDAVLASLPFTAAQIARLNELFDGALATRLYELLAQQGELVLYFQRADYRYEATASERWLNQIRHSLWQRIPPSQFEEGNLDVHIISSNTHSVDNCLSAWLHERAGEITAWAARHAPRDLALLDGPDRLYVAYRAWAKAHPHAEDERTVADQAQGMTILEDTSLAGIRVNLIDANRLATGLDPAIGALALQQPTLLVNIDYAYGQQARLIMQNLILLFGQRIRSISILGKSGATVGRRGDILLPNKLLYQPTGEIYPILNPDLCPASLQAVGWGRAIHQGALLTVLGTIMQSHDLLQYYRVFWNVIGMEMEGSFYLREILRARELGFVRPDVQLRFAYYTSDTPLEHDASLATALSTNEGVPPVYAITRAVLRRVLEAG